MALRAVSQSVGIPSNYDVQHFCEGLDEENASRRDCSPYHLVRHKGVGRWTLGWGMHVVLQKVHFCPWCGEWLPGKEES